MVGASLKKSNKSVLFCLVIFLTFGCSYVNESLKDSLGGYVVKGDTVIYHTGLYGLGTKRSWEVAGADAATFKPINEDYGTDNARAYLNGFAIPDSDGATFKILKAPYATDKSRVFYGNLAISDAPNDFKILAEIAEKGTISTDRKKVFLGGEQFLPDKADAATFERVGNTEYFRDKPRVYIFDRIVEGADPQTFIVTPGHGEVYARDKANVFYNGYLVQECDITTHQIIDSNFHRDGKRLFYAARKLSDDVENFKKLDAEYSKDSRSVYWQTDKIAADPASFVSFPSDRFEAYAGDGKRAFRCDKEVTGVDAETFAGLDGRYAKDKNNVYFSVQCEAKLSTVKGADSATFELVTSVDNVDARDKNNNYNFGTNRGPKK